jgi:hypothetical protein
MEAMERTSGYALDVRERAVRMVVEHEGEHESQCAALESIAAPPEGLRVFRAGGTRPSTAVMVAFIDAQRETYERFAPSLRLA